ncbi:MAG: thiamine pyrophosphate-dependent enzyme [Myxococcota bacterium]
MVCWIGHEARHDPEGVRSLVQSLGAAVLATPRGKGIVSERDPAFLGVTGLGGARGVRERLAQTPPDVGLVLGCRLSEFSSWWDESLVPPQGFISVGPNPSTAAFPDAEALSLHVDVGRFARALAASNTPTQPFTPPPALPREVCTPSGDGIHPIELMNAIQDEVVDRTEATILSEAGNAFAWATRSLQFEQPRYRVSPDFGSMGHAAAGVVGTALAHRRPCVALVGDGAMLMNTELNTAVQHDAPAVWVVLNDAGYGMIRHGMEAIGETPSGTAFPRVDFVAFARAQGADGLAVEHPAGLRSALRAAIHARKPFVVDVRMDATIPPPFGSRNSTLTAGEMTTWRG